MIILERSKFRSCGQVSYIRPWSPQLVIPAEYGEQEFISDGSHDSTHQLSSITNAESKCDNGTAAKHALAVKTDCTGIST